ncbi:MAG: glutamyl-tRNA reductase [Bacteroidales bacterium]
MIAILGISHKSAPVSVREAFAFDDQEKTTFIKQIKQSLSLEGIVILSTCNRTEIYLHTAIANKGEVFNRIADALLEHKHAANQDRGIFYFLTGASAVEHLFKVSSGLESMVIGEDQIIGQVKEAFRHSQKTKSADSILSRLFTKAIEAGKRVRTETRIKRGAASVSSAAAELCHKIFPDLQTITVLIVGAGQTADLVLQGIMKKIQPEIIIANRTPERAEKLAKKYGGRAIALSAVESVIAHCDLVIAATSSKERLITREIAESSMAGRQFKKQVYIDLSVPANISKQVDEIEKVRYYGMDELQTIVIKNMERRKSAIQQSMIVIGEVMEEFMQWMDIQNLTPTIMSIKENMKNFQQTELENFKKVNKIKEHALIDQYSEHISEKYARIFIRRLKEVTENGKNPEYLRVINNLFEPTGNDK